MGVSVPGLSIWSGPELDGGALEGISGSFPAGDEYYVDGDRPSHKHLRTKGRRGLGWVNHHLRLLRGERFFQHCRSPRSTFQQATNFRPPWAVFCIVILVTDKTRILGLAFGSFLRWSFRGILLGLISFILPFSLLFSFRGFIRRGGLNGVDLRSINGTRHSVRSIFIRSIRLLLPRVRRRFLRMRIKGTNDTVNRWCWRGFGSSRSRGIRKIII